MRFCRFHFSVEDVSVERDGYHGVVRRVERSSSCNVDREGIKRECRVVVVVVVVVSVMMMMMVRKRDSPGVSSCAV